MKRKPGIIILIAILHLLEPFFRLGIFYFLYKVTPAQYLSLLLKQNDLQYLFSFAIYPVGGLAILIYKRWSFYFYLGLQFLVIVINTRFLLEMIHFPVDAMYVINILLFIFTPILTVYFLLPVVRRTFLDVSLQWWTSKPRYLINFPSTIDASGKKISGEVVNISETGVFLKASGLKADDVFTFTFKSGEQTIEQKARVVYVNQERQGLGAEFIDSSGEQKKAMRILCKELRRQGVITSQGPMNDWEDFKIWIRNLIKGKGIFPQY